MGKLAIIVPVFNDWESLRQLLFKLDEQANAWGYAADIIVVDDGSTIAGNLDFSAEFVHLREIILISLACNVGHQRAIAIGLTHANKQGYDCVVVMDSDGEDRPEDIAHLIKSHASNPHSIIAARRAQRSEGGGFRLFYLIYKICFLAFTGKKIDFGNFCLVPRSHLVRLVHMGELWNHLAATILKSRVPLTKISTSRGTRYAGKSSMNFVSLTMHGLSAAAVFGDLLFVRLLVMSIGIVMLSAVGAAIVIGIRFVTALAIPGWATTTMGLASLLFIQGLTLSATAAFMTLNNRSSFPFVPVLHALEFVRDIRKIKANV